MLGGGCLHPMFFPKWLVCYMHEILSSNIVNYLRIQMVSHFFSFDVSTFSLRYYVIHTTASV